MNFHDYKLEGFYDELFEAEGCPRQGTAPLIEAINSLPTEELKIRQKAAEAEMLRLGVTFNVYKDNQRTERIFPFDLIPRIIEARSWEPVERGLQQRIEALNLFIQDVYDKGKIIKDGVVPKALIESADGYRKQCIGFKPPKNIWIHVTGTDLVRDESGQIYVLEDNLRCPSGVSYALENRSVQKRIFPHAFKKLRVQPIHDYSERLLKTLEHLAPTELVDPTVVVLTPGIYNSAYFEHAFLAQQMGVQLVEGRDMLVKNGDVMIATTQGYEKVDVIYRRIDDDFIDPKEFNKDSLLGVPGLMEAYRKGRVALANGIGTGFADDKAVYAYTPDIIKYYLGEDALLPIVPTYLCERADDMKYVLENLESLVVKRVNLSGGSGMLIGPASTKTERQDFAEQIKKHPRHFIAQPTLALSRSPTICGDELEGRHVDLRPYILYGESIYVQPGGLTRVALKKGSLVVNSSQGGGSKDTWVLSKTNEKGGR